MLQSCPADGEGPCTKLLAHGAHKLRLSSTFIPAAQPSRPCCTCRTSQPSAEASAAAPSACAAARAHPAPAAPAAIAGGPTAANSHADPPDQATLDPLGGKASSALLDENSRASGGNVGLQPGFLPDEGVWGMKDICMTLQGTCVRCSA